MDEKNKVGWPHSECRRHLRIGEKLAYNCCVILHETETNGNKERKCMLRMQWVLSARMTMMCTYTVFH